ncbi:uncharacterized protein LOC127787502 [Diospyros lotus]|uniref:uncharacterized protein LOC127787502 n=1 Tax=Diospyros lotus TaxID=55363 RepID=UPI002250B7E9|nr:uncharacterized protein LOC127787502 [Diospyros lotus]
MLYVAPGTGELYYLRTLLNIVYDTTTYDDIKTINGVVYSSFRDACYALGLLNDDKEYIDGIVEASQWGTTHSLRNLFATLLTLDSLSRPEYVWSKCWQYLSDDILYRHRSVLGHADLQLIDNEIQSYALLEIENILQGKGKSLREFDGMPFLDDVDELVFGNRLIYDELSYDRKKLTEDHKNYVNQLTDEQRYAYDRIMHVVDGNEGGVFFLNGFGGIGKTFIWKTLSAGIRSKGNIVLNVASSGIASLLLLGGRTTHSRFSIPLNPIEDSTCNIRQGSPLAELIAKTKLIIWDEALMMHRYCFEALDKTMRDVLRFAINGSNDKPFGGKTIVFDGDFRQILPLTKNMRLQSSGNCHDVHELKDFSDWLCNIGDGKIGRENDGKMIFDIPRDVLVGASDDTIQSIVESTCPSFLENVCDASYMQRRAILAPTLDDVQDINDFMISKNPCEERIYLSSDTMCHTERVFGLFAKIHSTKFLNGIRCSGVPNHELKLNIGVPVMLMRNIDHALRLCNGTRLVITKLGCHALEAKMLSGGNAGDKPPSTPSSPFATITTASSPPLALMFAVIAAGAEASFAVHLRRHQRL